MHKSYTNQDLHITLQKSNQLKSIAILMMLFLHLFNRDYTGLFQPLLFVGNQPLSYYISLFCDACVPIFAFVSGYGLYYKFKAADGSYRNGNILRLKKLSINYWIILVIFAVVLGLILGKEGYPGNIKKLLLNISGLDPSYNGAWWFFTTYVFFVLSSGFWFRILDKVNPYIFCGVLLFLYLVAFYFRIYKVSLFENTFLNYLHRQSALYFCTLFQFMIGAFALKYKWNDKVLSTVFGLTRYRNTLSLLLIVSAIVLHALIPNFIVAPFTGLIFIFAFTQMKLSVNIDRFLDFFTPHATNLWLIHMFFYMIYFPEFIYSPHYVFPIFMLLVAVTLLSSYLVQLIEKPVTKILFPSKPQPQS